MLSVLAGERVACHAYLLLRVVLGNFLEEQLGHIAESHELGLRVLIDAL